MAKLEITLKRSLIGKKPLHKKNVEALGLKRIGQTVVHDDSPSIRGMVNMSDYLLEVRESQ